MWLAPSGFGQGGEWSSSGCRTVFVSRHMYTCCESTDTQIHRSADVELGVSYRGSLNIMVQLIKALCSRVIPDLQYVFPLTRSADVTFRLCFGWV